MKRYENYQSINLPWLKKIPSDWSLKRNKVFLRESRDTVGENSKDYTLLSLTLNGIIPRDIASGKGKFPSDFSTYKIIKPDDIVFCFFDIDETPRTVGLSSFNGMTTGAYNIFHIDGINSHYMYYYYLALDNGKAMRPLYKGLRKTIGIDTFLGTKMPVPPRAEQDQIVRYLDWQVSKINRLIAAKRKQIKLLNAQKHAFVSHYVTRGLAENAPLKNSGVNWLSAIPAHWSIRKLRTLLTPYSEKNQPNLPLLSVVREKGVIVRNVEDTEENHNFIPDDLSGYKVVRKDQFVINKMKSWQGSYGIAPCDGIVSPAYFVFDIDFDNLEYFHYAIRSKIYVNFFAQASDGIRVGQWDLSIDKMKDIPFIIPPSNEQAEIVSRIKKEIVKTQEAISGVEKQISALEELRTRLISDVVTGQIDVRNIKVPDFEYVNEETIDDSIEEELEENEEE